MASSLLYLLCITGAAHAGQCAAGQVAAGQVMLPACICRHSCTPQVLQHLHCAGSCDSHKAHQRCIHFSIYYSLGTTH